MATTHRIQPVISKGRSRRSWWWDALALVSTSSSNAVFGCALLHLSTSDFFGHVRQHGQGLGLGCLLLSALNLVVTLGPVSSTLSLGKISSNYSSWVSTLLDHFHLRIGRSSGRSALTHHDPGGGLLSSSSTRPPSVVRRVEDKVALRTALLVGLMWALFSASNLRAQVGREVEVDCGLAEASVRVQHLESKLTAMKHDEMLINLFFRLNEMDDMLNMVHEGAVGAAEARHLMESAKMKDKEYIGNRVARLQRHAQNVAAELRTRSHMIRHNPDSDSKDKMTTGSSASTTSSHNKGYDGQRTAHQQRDSTADAAYDHGSSEPSMMTNSDEYMQSSGEVAAQRSGGSGKNVLWLLQKRIEAVDSVIHYLESKHLREELTYEEYEMILGALIEGGSQGALIDGGTHGAFISGTDVIDVESLKRDHAELPSLKQAFDRKSDETVYQQLVESGPHVRAVRQIAAKREAARKEFEERFMSSVDQQGNPLHPKTFKSSLLSALDNLPDHCIREMSGIALIHWLSFGLSLSLLLSAYLTLTALLVTVADDKKIE
ncbi:hypothetical protein CEUSTIGMA_g9172.t1 [Chlamydomonas eustigma]|uniref:Transmembrane protein n=1 Tax=Chlamydomonas eustigma TaxID=1157962 RepID=A0A250XF83_9CHLO|nr:hypothetical protein CEUSTIGMA_g9172.t1 [Chlamydomonas eustigma]|eukprot:GAX81744.1 hypothetical protein CEUSTIGMA_g9172.t1 [Chlamydomonas eustigma]